jgi:prolyl 4-hydroxylase
MGEKLAQEQHPTQDVDAHVSWCLKVTDKTNEALKRISDRMSLWAVLPPSHGEEFCVMRQEAGQPDLPTLSDDFPADKDPAVTTSGKRKATLILHLNTVEEGMEGELLFPKAANGPLKVPAFAGDALLLWNQNPDRSESAGAVWGSKSPKKGVKWSLVRWLRERPLSK